MLFRLHLDFGKVPHQGLFSKNVSYCEIAMNPGRNCLVMDREFSLVTENRDEQALSYKDKNK